MAHSLFQFYGNTDNWIIRIFVVIQLFFFNIWSSPTKAIFLLFLRIFFSVDQSEVRGTIYYNFKCATFSRWLFARKYPVEILLFNDCKMGVSSLLFPFPIKQSCKCCNCSLLRYYLSIVHACVWQHRKGCYFISCFIIHRCLIPVQLKITQ